MRYAINVGALGGLLSSPHHPISPSPHLLLVGRANFFMEDTPAFRLTIEDVTPTARRLFPRTALPIDKQKKLVQYNSDVDHSDAQNNGLGEPKLAVEAQ